MGEKEQGAATAREAGSGMATGRVFPEANVAQSDAEGGGIAIEEEGVQRTGQPLGSAAYARGAGTPPVPAAATNLNSSRSNIYRTGGGGPASDEEAAEAPIPGKPSKEQRVESGLEAAAERSVGSGSEEQMGRDPASAGEGGGGGGDPLETSNLNLSKSNINRTTTGDPDFDLTAAKQKAEPGPKSQ